MVSKAGEGKRILLVNDRYVVARIFFDLIKGPMFEYASSANDAIRKIRSSIKKKKPFNAVLIDKNLEDNPESFGKHTGLEKTIIAIQRISPKTHIAIHSGEEGPGKFQGYFFIKIDANLERLEREAGAFFKMLEKTPFLQKPVKISLHAIARPVPIFKPWTGTIEVVEVIEGQGFGTKAMTLMQMGGKVLNLPDAIEFGPDRFKSSGDYDRLQAEKERIVEIGRKVLPVQKRKKPRLVQRKFRRR